MIAPGFGNAVGGWEGHKRWLFLRRTHDSKKEPLREDVGKSSVAKWYFKAGPAEEQADLEREHKLNSDGPKAFTSGGTILRARRVQRVHPWTRRNRLGRSAHPDLYI